MSTETVTTPRPRIDGQRPHRTDLLGTRAAPTVPRNAPPAEIRHPWATRDWPATAAEESDFVAELAERADRQLLLRPVPDDAPTAELDRTAPRAVERRDVTAVVTALRSGMTVDALLRAAPGLKPAKLLAAHASLDGRRAASVAAWRSITAEPTSASLEAHRGEASALLPALIDQISIEVARTGDVERVIGRASGQVERTTSAVLALEQKLAAETTSPQRARQIGELLFDARSTAGWDLETFLPTRVGTLVPARVASLLAERGSDLRARWC